MDDRPPERDWKVFRKLHAAAYERRCATAVADLARICGDGSRSAAERQEEASRVVREHDRDLARLFPDPRRSRMMLQLANLLLQELVRPEELDRFTEETRESVESLVRGLRRI